MKRGHAVAIAVVVAIAATAAGAFVAQRRYAAEAAGLAAAKAASELFYGQRLPDANGVVRDMSEHRGKVVVVNFWATWCVPCVEEIPAFSRVHAEVAGRVGFVGLGIDSPGAINAFNAQFRPSYPLLVAGTIGSDLARAFGDSAGALPFTVVLGTDGQVVATRLGRVDERMLREWLAPYVKAS